MHCTDPKWHHNDNSPRWIRRDLPDPVADAEWHDQVQEHMAAHREAEDHVTPRQVRRSA